MTSKTQQLRYWKIKSSDSNVYSTIIHIINRIKPLTANYAKLYDTAKENELLQIVMDIYYQMSDRLEYIDIDSFIHFMNNDKDQFIQSGRINFQNLFTLILCSIDYSYQSEFYYKYEKLCFSTLIRLSDSKSIESNVFELDLNHKNPLSKIITSQYSLSQNRQISSPQFLFFNSQTSRSSIEQKQEIFIEIFNDKTDEIRFNYLKYTLSFIVLRDSQNSNHFLFFFLNCSKSGYNWVKFDGETIVKTSNEDVYHTIVNNVVELLGFVKDLEQVDYFDFDISPPTIRFQEILDESPKSYDVSQTKRQIATNPIGSQDSTINTKIGTTDSIYNNSSTSISAGTSTTSKYYQSNKFAQDQSKTEKPIKYDTPKKSLPSDISYTPQISSTVGSSIKEQKSSKFDIKSQGESNISYTAKTSHQSEKLLNTGTTTTSTSSFDDKKTPSRSDTSSDDSSSDVDEPQPKSTTQISRTNASTTNLTSSKRPDVTKSKIGSDYENDRKKSENDVKASKEASTSSISSPKDQIKSEPSHNTIHNISKTKNDYCEYTSSKTDSIHNNSLSKSGSKIIDKSDKPSSVSHSIRGDYQSSMSTSNTSKKEKYNQISSTTGRSQSASRSKTSENSSNAKLHENLSTNKSHKEMVIKRYLMSSIEKLETFTFKNPSKSSDEIVAFCASHNLIKSINKAFVIYSVQFNPVRLTTYPRDTPLNQLPQYVNIQKRPSSSIYYIVIFNKDQYKNLPDEMENHYYAFSISYKPNREINEIIYRILEYLKLSTLNIHYICHYDNDDETFYKAKNASYFDPENPIYVPLSESSFHLLSKSVDRLAD